MKLFQFFKAIKLNRKAQSLVEFALILPLLLLLIFGLIDTGRLLFQYSMVTNAAREGARYGVATGESDITANTLRFADCAGIEAAAQGVAFLEGLDTISIQYDRGPGSAAGSVATSCATLNANNIVNGDRIVVTVTSTFSPVTPLSPLEGLTITSTSARSIIRSIDIAGGPTPIPPTIVVTNSTPGGGGGGGDTETPSHTPSNTPPPTSGGGGGTNTPTPSRTNTPEPTRIPTHTETATATLDPFLTPEPTRAATATDTPTSTPMATAITTCSNVTWVSTLNNGGNNWTLSITNNTTVPLLIQDATLTWNHDDGHKTGSDKTLKLIKVEVSTGTPIQIWPVTGAGTPTPTPVASSPITVTPTNVYIPTGTSSLILTFHQSYDSDRTEATDQILIRLATNGCQANPIIATTP